MTYSHIKKAFDKVRHRKLIEILKGGGLDERNICIIATLYTNQRASVRLGQDLSPEFLIKRGIGKRSTANVV